MSQDVGMMYNKEVPTLITGKIPVIPRKYGWTLVESKMLRRQTTVLKKDVDSIPVIDESSAMSMHNAN